jgi:murein DD-endopeptidase MepM/ murein hydrolase activator NlpD
VRSPSFARIDTPQLTVDASLPPLGLDGADTAPNSGPVSAKWLTALFLLAVVATLLILGALRTLGPHLHFAATPAVFVRVLGSVAKRTDRLMATQGQRSSGVTRSRIEQLNDSGLGTTPFTHVIAHLLEFPGASIAGTVGPTRPPATPSSVPREILASSPADGLPATVTAFAASDDESPGTIAPPPGQVINGSVIAKAVPGTPSIPRVIIARPGDTLPKILQILGTAAQDSEAITALLTPRRWLRSNAFAGGEKITVLADETDATHAVFRPLEVSIERQGGKKIAAARADAGGFIPVVWPVDPDSPKPDVAATRDEQLRSSSGESIREGLYGMAQANGIDRTLIDEIVRLCGYDVDLDGLLAGNDTAELLFSTNDLGEPELAFTALTLNGHVHRYYRYTAPDDNSTDYYDAAGRSVTQSLLRKPVAAGKLGDGFGWRIHPVLGDERLHQGVDYAAPFGSPIVAAAAGAVEAISQQTGYGKYVRIRHDLGYETTYAHISNIARGLHVGERVRQGQTIAFVGSTGYSTGPHLYYEVRINGRNVDPLRVKLRTGRVLEGDALAAFEAKRDRSDLLLQASIGRTDAR